jgi:hypothetical protein
MTAIALPRINIDGAARWIGSAALLTVPLVTLVVWPGTFSPYASGKTEIFRWLCMGWCVCLLFNLRAMPATVWLYGAFVAALALADSVAVNRQTAFWGEDMRIDGFVAMASYLAYFVALTILPRGEKFWTWLLRGWAISGVVVSLASLLQSLHFLVIYYPVPRAYGLMGSPVFFGDYLALTILFTLWAAKDSKLWLAALLFQIPVLLMTGSRSAMAGAMIGAICLIPGKLKWAILMLGLALAVQIGSSWHMAMFADLSYRFGCYQNELSVIMKHPWLGYGQENLHVLCMPENWDRSHNFALQALADAGVLGLAAYLAFLADAFKSVMGKPFALAIFAAYLVMLMVEPDCITTIIPMLTALGWAGRIA